MNPPTSAILSPEDLERLWITFQLEIAAMRPALFALYGATIEGRRGHTFVPGQQPPETAVRCIMQATADEWNGIPDILGDSTKGSYAARTLSVAAASTILTTFDLAIQTLARRLGQPDADKMMAGEDIPSNRPGAGPIKASTLIWAAANSVRHIEEWQATATSFLNPKNADEKWLRSKQERSMQPIADVLGMSLPVTENVAYEMFHLLVMLDEQHGSYERMEFHVLRIGQDMIHRGGLIDAPIGVTLTQTLARDQVAPERLVVVDGVARTASSVPGVDDLILAVRPHTQQDQRRDQQ